MWTYFVVSPFTISQNSLNAFNLLSETLLFHGLHWLPCQVHFRRGVSFHIWQADFWEMNPKNYYWFGFYMQAIAKIQACLALCLSRSRNSQLVLYDTKSFRTGCPRKIVLVSVRMCQILGDNFFDDDQKASSTTPITSKRTNSENPKLIVRCQLNCNWTPTFCPPSHCRCV